MLNILPKTFSERCIIIIGLIISVGSSGKENLRTISVTALVDGVIAIIDLI